MVGINRKEGVKRFHLLNGKTGDVEECRANIRFAFAGDHGEAKHGTYQYQRYCELFHISSLVMVTPETPMEIYFFCLTVPILGEGSNSV